MQTFLSVPMQILDFLFLRCQVPCYTLVEFYKFQRKQRTETEKVCKQFNVLHILHIFLPFQFHALLSETFSAAELTICSLSQDQSRGKFFAPQH